METDVEESAGTKGVARAFASRAADTRIAEPPADENIVTAMPEPDADEDEQGVAIDEVDEDEDEDEADDKDIDDEG